MTLRTMSKNHAADPEIGFFTKSISKSGDHAESVGVKFFFFYPFTKWSEQMQNLFFSILRQY